MQGFHRKEHIGGLRIQETKVAPARTQATLVIRVSGVIPAEHARS